MADDKKQVIYDLERCTCHVPDACRDCSKHRHWSGNAVTCMESLMEDALDLLKEPEAKQVELHGNEEWWGPVCVCPDCKAGWMSDKADTHFCPKCGRPVKWE